MDPHTAAAGGRSGAGQCCVRTAAMARAVALARAEKLLVVIVLAPHGSSGAFFGTLCWPRDSGCFG
jgi:hypothetical protein